ncbi:hypothetical protein TrLO_g2781 [Triparma laevis f. longispina]|uniref:Uncharacterized protein n=1 Tax=Triparma laevis f. longispina TaxID=1714387 RepID=A0A9W7L028_9STRA|nr:hypothetical protein TrLO_g2781 [Triparma laevis f. longispina]
MHTPEFRKHFIDLVHVQTLMALRVVTKGFNVAADTLIDEGVRSGDLMVHDGKDIHMLVAVARKERRNGILQMLRTKIDDDPDSLQTLGEYVFVHCYKLVPSNIRTNDNDAVVDHLRSQQQIS